MAVEYQYIVSDYYATGEGRTVCILITRAYPRAGDYEGDNELVKPAIRAWREFAERFDGWYARGAEVLTREEFVSKHGNHVPKWVLDITDPDVKDGPGNFSWACEHHMNFS